MAGPSHAQRLAQEQRAAYLAELSDADRFDYDIGRCTRLADLAALAYMEHGTVLGQLYEISGLFETAAPERIKAAEATVDRLRRRLERIRALAEQMAKPHMVTSIGAAFGEYTAAAGESARLSLLAIRSPTRRAPSTRFVKSQAWKSAAARVERARERLVALAHANSVPVQLPTTERPRSKTDRDTAALAALGGGRSPIASAADRADMIRQNASKLRQIPNLQTSQSDAACQAGQHIQRAMELGAFEGGPRDAWLAPLRERLSLQKLPGHRDPHISVFAETVFLARSEQGGDGGASDVTSASSFEIVALVLEAEAARLVESPKGEGNQTRTPLSPRARLIFDKLAALKPHEALTLPRLLEGLPTSISDSVFYRDLRPELQAWGMKNAPRKGYYLER